MQTSASGWAHRRRLGRALASVSLASLLSACLSSGPPAPPVRWFDPLAGSEPANLVAAALQARVVAAPHLRSEFAVRVGEHEIAFDDDHRWLEPPADLVAKALRRVGVAAAAERGSAVVQLECFEFDRTGEPRAHLRLVVQPGEHDSGDGVVDVSVPAGDDSPAGLVAAMARALPQAAERVRALLAAGGD